MLASAQKAMESASRSPAAADSPLEHGLTGTLEELRRAAQSLRGLADYLQRHPDALLRGKSPDAFHESGRSLMRSVLRAGVIAMVTAVSGCSSAPTHFYTLLPPPSNTSVPEASFAVHIEPVAPCPRKTIRRRGWCA